MEINHIRDVSLPKSFYDFLSKINSDDKLTRIRDTLLASRDSRLKFSRETKITPYEWPKSDPSKTDWKANLEPWLQDQRNQMTGPADDEKLVVKLINSGSPGIMLDLEDSMANKPKNLIIAHRIIKSALAGEAFYYRDIGKQQIPIRVVAKIGSTKTVVWVRVRGLHVGQLVDDKDIGGASLFDLAMHFYDMELDSLVHPPCIYIPKSESAAEALWWKLAFSRIEEEKGWKEGTIKCMALVEAHPLAFEIEQFSYYLQPYIVGLNLGRWDYMASLIDYMYNQPDWLFPDRNSIPSDVPFFQNLRHWMAHVCHKHGMLAIGGMTALFPSRTDEELNTKALVALAYDKVNEAACFMDGAWTGHPDQNEIAVLSFPEPNQIDCIPPFDREPDLQSFENIYPATEEGTREAIRVCIQYRQAVAEGKGAKLINGYMEDLATDRIYRIMIAQRIDRGIHTMLEFENMLAEELKKLNSNHEYDNRYSQGASDTLRLISERQFNPR